MDDEVKKWLFDIRASIDSINNYVGDRRIFEEYERNKILRRAVEREIEIIGEAISRLRKHSPDIIILNSAQIMATRNRIVHAYDAVNNSIIWGIVVNHLPGLQTEVENLLKD
jgi:uncharacterized protein with HEPN domain